MSLTISGVPVTRLARGLCLYVARRLRRPRGYMSSLLRGARGRTDLTPYERRVALGIDAMLRRLRVKCLWRAAVVTETLRGMGVAAQIRLSISTSDPRIAHAECEIGDDTLRLSGNDMVSLR